MIILYKMIILDLDGTILNSNRKISVNTKEYLTKLKNEGFIITIATGRIYASALKATDGAEFANYIISDTGSCIYDRLTEKIIYSNFIESKTASEVLDYYNDECNYIDICDKNYIYKYSDIEENHPVVITSKDKDYIINNCKKISHITISMKSNEEVIKLYNVLKEKFLDLDIIIMQDSFSDKKWIEMMAKGVSKYKSIKILSEHLGIKNDKILAFGDGLNDIEMLEKCGYGVALKNALSEVKEKANAITKFDHNNDGVIMYLKEYLYDSET